MARNRLIYGMVVVTLLVFIFLRPLPMTYWALYAVLLAPLVSLLFALVCYISDRTHGFLVTAELGSHYAEKGQSVPYTFTVQNPSFLPYFRVRICFQAENMALLFHCREADIFVPARKHASATIPVRADYRGNYNIGPDAVFLYDCLGLFCWKKEPPTPLSLCVVPQVHPLPSLPLDTQHRGEVTVHNQTPQGDHSELADLRQYYPTDSFRTIHWKASAKRNELMSKQFQDTEAYTVSLCIDNTAIHPPGQEALALEDRMMDALVSVMSYCAKRGYPVALYHPGAHKPAPVAEYWRLFQTAAGLEFDENVAFDAYLQSCLHPPGAHKNLILFLQDITSATVSALRLHGGRNVIVFLPFDRVDTAHVAQLQRAGVTCMDICNVIQKEVAHETT